MGIMTRTNIRRARDAGMTITTGKICVEALYEEARAKQDHSFFQSHWSWAKRWTELGRTLAIHNEDLSTFIPLIHLDRPVRGNDFMLLGEMDCDVRLWRHDPTKGLDFSGLAGALPEKTSLDLLFTHQHGHLFSVRSDENPISTDPNYPAFKGSDYFWTTKTRWDDFTQDWARKKRYNMNRDVAQLEAQYAANRVKPTAERLKRFMSLNADKYGEYYRFNPGSFPDRNILLNAWLANASNDGLIMLEYTEAESTEAVGYGMLYADYSKGGTLVIWGSAMSPEHPSLNKLFYRQAFDIAAAHNIGYVTPLANSHSWKDQWKFDSIPSFLVSNIRYRDYFE